MTYREAIQIQIAALQRVYDNIGTIRDYSDADEKKICNNLRNTLPGLWSQLQSIDNALTGHAAGYEMKGDYSVNINTDNL